MSKIFTYKLRAPDGVIVEYMTTGPKKNPKLKDLMGGHDMRVKMIEKYGWEVISENQEDPLADVAHSIQRCTVCGVEMDFKEGFSQKTGKKWKGHFCPKDKTHPPIWE